MDKAQEAADFIVSHCPRIGAFSGTGEPYGFLQQTAKDMLATQPTSVFRPRYIEHVAYAVATVGFNWFLSPPAAVASVYLATRFEFYFRVLSGTLNADGTWVSPLSQQQALATLGDPRLKNPRLSNVSLAYKVMQLGTSRVVPYFATLDSILYAAPTTASGNFPIEHLGDRIAFGRHNVGHGGWGDISAEAVFYGLMTAIVFYGQ